MEGRKKQAARNFMPDWPLKYGLEIATRDLSNQEVTSALCLFCANFGRDDEENSDDQRKRKRTAHNKYYRTPWRSDNITSHLKKQHPARWKEYDSLSTEAKKTYFQQQEVPESVTMRSFVQPTASAKAKLVAGQKCKYVIDADIIENLICGFFFESSEDEDENIRIEEAKRRALRYFSYNEDDNTYSVDVKSMLRLNLLVNFVSVGVSFRQASRLYESVRDETGMGVLGNISDVIVAHHCRLVCCVNLQYLKELLKDVWAFSIAIDAGNNIGTSYLDLRMRSYFKGGLQNFHILAIPMRERHTGEYQYDLIVQALNVLSPNWRHQLIGVSTDGASTMTGCIQGTCTRLSQECHGNIFRIWCGAHQLDLVIKKAFADLLDDRFLGIVSGVTGHLRRQQNLIRDMKTTCPTYVSTRWISMGKLLKWLKMNRVRLLVHFDLKKPSVTPPMEWWIVVEVIQTLVARIEDTFVAMQGLRTLVCEQRQLLVNLERDIKSRFDINGPMTNEELAAFTTAVEDDPSFGFSMENYCISRQGAMAAIDEVGGFVQMSMDELKENDMQVHDNILTTVATFALQVVAGISKVCAERDDQNSASFELPPVLPLDLCSMHARDFTACLQKQRTRLKQKFSDEDIEKIDMQFRKLRIDFKEQRGFGTMLHHAQAGHSVQSFEICWKVLGKEEYGLLETFCGGIASVMAGTSSVEADFSHINWTKDSYSKSLTDFSLESILHCKQYKQLRDLFE